MASEKTAPAHGSVLINGTDILYTPVADYHGEDSFVITLTDGNGFSVDKTVSVSVSSVNDVPTITIDSTLSTDEDNHSTLRFSFNDVDGDTVVASEKTAPAHGSVLINGTDILYTPVADYHGEDSFVITLTDGNGFSVDKTVSVSVSSINDVPTITIDSTLSTDEDNHSTLSFSFNDVDGDTVVASEKTAPAHGSVLINGTDIQYTPVADYHGEDSFVITLTDSNGFSVDKTVSVSVSSINDVPTITIDSTLSTDEDNHSTLSFSFNDVDGDTVVASEKTAPAHGSVQIDGTDILYTPVADYHGEDSFVITLTDGNGFSVDKTVSVSVSSINDAPVATDDNDFAFSANDQGRYVLDVLANDTDIDQDVLHLLWVTTDVGQASIDGASIVLETASIGKVNLKYGIADPHGASAMGHAKVQITSDNALAPTIVAPSPVEVDATALFTKVDLGVAVAEDSQGRPLPVSLVDGDTFFAPGRHTVYWHTQDENGLEARASQEVIVHPLISISKDDTTIEGTTHTVKVFLNGEAPSYPLTIPYTVSGSSDGDDHTLTDGEVVINEGTEGSLSFTLQADDQIEGTETLQITLDKQLNLGSKSRYTLTVYEDNVAPEVSVSVAQQGELRPLITNNEQLVTLTATVSDPDANDDHQYHWINDNPQLANISQQEAQFVFSPQGLTPGNYQLQLAVSDSQGASVTTDVYFEVVAELTVLGDEDSDGDLIPDNQEGLGDSDNDGILDYQDAIDECNVIQEQALES
ncbi:Ig-like domain-containing protein, partial [Shewanella sp. YIC-542]|uniref:Ig-like domain-containing protein n=1 Tax=Shewanella mytili TaxID=3377111 RepID=UPI00398EF930